MKLHYQGKYDLDPASLPHGEHQPGAVPFKEPKSSKSLSLLANGLSVLIFVLLILPVVFRDGFLYNSLQYLLGAVLSLLLLFPHELLHALCFREDVYLYTNWQQGMLFVVGPETMSKRRFILMSLCPNLVLGLLPYLLGLFLPRLPFLAVWGALSLSMGAGDYINVFNALRQMPRGSRTYLYGFHSWWYLPQDRA